MSRRVRFRDLLPAGVEPVNGDDDPIFSPLEKGQQPKVLHSIFSPDEGGTVPFATFPSRLNSSTWSRNKNKNNNIMKNDLAIYTAESLRAPYASAIADPPPQPQPLQIQQPKQKSSVVVEVPPTQGEYCQVPADSGSSSPPVAQNDSDSLHRPSQQSPGSDVPAMHDHGDAWTPRKSRTKGGRQNAQNQYPTNDPFRKSSKNQKSPVSLRDLSEILISPSGTALSSLASSPTTLEFSHFDRSADAPSDRTTTTNIITDDVTASNKSVTSTSTAFRTLEKLEWLELDSIRQCNSIPQLVRIIAVLQAETTTASYPSLLRAARERLVAVRGPSLPDNNNNNNTISLEGQPKHSWTTTECDDNHHQSPMAPISPDSVMTNVSQRLSTTADNDNNVPEMDKSSRSTSTGMNDASQSSLVMSLSTDVDYEEECYGIRPATTQHGNEREHELREQVDRLTQTIIEMEQLTLMDAPSCQCQNTPWRSEMHPALQDLQHPQQAGVDMKELLQSMQDLRTQNQELQEQIQQEAAEREQKGKVSEDMENRLFTQIHELQLQLTQVRGQSAKDQSSYQSKQLELNQSLRTAQRSLQRLQADRDTLIQTLLQATGRSESVADLSQREQRRLVQDVCQRAASNQRNVDQMAQQVTEAERHRVYAVQAQRKSEARLMHTVKSIRQLQHENSMLMGQIQSLSEELRASRQQLDKLYSSGEATKLKEFQVREQSYKQIIKEMKEQLNKNNSDAVVPVDVYRKALAEAQQCAAECQSYREDANTLAGRVAKLEKQLKQERSHTTKMIPPPPPPNVKAPVVPTVPSVSPPSTELSVSVHGKIAAKKQSQILTSSLKSGRFNKNATLSKKVQIASPKSAESVVASNSSRVPSSPTPANDIENGGNTWPAQKQSPTWTKAKMTPSPRSADRSVLRSSVVRAAGGRRALQQKLRAMRSPKSGVEHYNRKLEQMGIRPLPLREAIYKQQR